MQPVRHKTPADIEETSMRIITEELQQRGVTLAEEQASVVRRVIHTTADFDYAENLFFTANAVSLGIAALCQGTTIVTDTNMGLSGVSKKAMEKLNCQARCFMAEPSVMEEAQKRRTTRAVISMEKAAAEYQNPVFAVGNAPTALYALAELIEEGFRPALVIAVPVGFVNVVEAKETIRETCQRHGVPLIAAMGRKGGSNVAAAICNALLYSATDMLAPQNRGWH